MHQGGQTLSDGMEWACSRLGKHACVQGGQAQRVTLAICLALRPAILLLDEVCGSQRDSISHSFTLVTANLVHAQASSRGAAFSA